MAELVRFAIRAVMFSIVGLLAIGLFARLVQRAPGVFVGLSGILICLFGYAIYKGSLQAIGLHTRRSVVLSFVASVIVFTISITVLFTAT